MSGSWNETFIFAFKMLQGSQNSITKLSCYMLNKYLYVISISVWFVKCEEITKGLFLAIFASMDFSYSNFILPNISAFFFLMFQLNYQGYVYILKCNFSRFHHFIYKFQFQVSCNLLRHCLCLTRYVSLSTWQSVLSTQIWSIFMKNTTAVWQKYCKYCKYNEVTWK